MKKLVYKIEGYTSVYNHETEKVKKQLSLSEIVIESPTKEQIEKAAEIAYNGEYTVEDDGQPELQNSTSDDVLNTLLGVSV